MSVQILLTALERIENHESGEIIAKNDSCEECRHMIDIAEKALAEYDAAPDHTVVTCVYCGMEYPNGTPAAKAEILTEHIKVCTSHPMHTVTKERDELKRALASQIENDAKSVSNSCPTHMKTGIELIAAERERQILQEGWTPEHDDGHSLGELSEAAACYAMVASANVRGSIAEEWPATMLNGFNDSLMSWPWNDEWWKPSDDPARNLIKAGALIAAEIDRLQRASKS